MASRHAFVTYDEQGRRQYWYYPSAPPRRRHRRERQEILALLNILFPIPPDPGDPRDSEDADERRRMRAVAQLRWELQFKVYAACDWERPRNDRGDDPLDPVIDYHLLKDKLSCVRTLKYYIPAFDILEYAWEASAPFNWAPLDVVHTGISAGDDVMQRHIAAGGDPQPVAVMGYVDVSDDE